MRATRVVPEPLFYPFPTLLTVAPFALLPIRLAAAAFVAVSAAFLAFALVRRSPERLPLFLGAGFFVAVGLGQWSPLVTATLLIPSLAWLAVLKPNIGLAVTAAKPTWIGVLGGGLLLVATLAIQPNWPSEWIRNLRSMPGHPIPIFLPGGAVLLVALLRWRRWEARLLLAMAAVPQLLFFADQLPLWLIPRTRKQTTLLSGLSLIGYGAFYVSLGQGDRYVPAAAPFVLAFVYLPALALVLLAPGPVPRATGRTPSVIDA
jgi:hypothetical protein